MSNDTIDSIEELARQIVTDAQAKGVPLDQRIEALKTLAPIYTALRRHASKDEGDEDDNDFNGFRKQIGEAQINGTPPVRGRRGNA